MITIKYESKTLIPIEIEKALAELSKSIKEDKYEDDKIICDLSRFRKTFLNWIDSHKEAK